MAAPPFKGEMADKRTESDICSLFVMFWYDLILGKWRGAANG